MTLDNSFCAVLWFIDEKTNNQSHFFKEFDYLTNGLLSKSNKLEGLYQTINFDKTISIALVSKSDQEQFTIAAKSSMALIKKTDDTKKVLIIHNTDEKNLEQKFSKAYSGFSFTVFEHEKEL